MLGQGARSRGQIAFEFLIVFSFILIVFVVVFVLIASQRASVLNIQQYSALQLVSQNIASYIDQAVAAGNGYNATIQLASNLGSTPYNITMSTTGVVIASIRLGQQVISAQAFSSARGLAINGTELSQSSNSIQLFEIPATGTLKIANLNGIVYIDSSPAQISELAQHMRITNVTRVLTPVFNGANSCAADLATPGLVNELPNFTISGWVYANSNAIANDMVIYSEAAPYNTTLFKIEKGGALCVSTFNRNRGAAGSWVDFCSPTAVQPKNWTYVSASLSNGHVGNGIFTLRVNNATSSGGGQQENASVDRFGIGCDAGMFAGQASNSFNGSIADLQIYNNSLSQKQAESLYTLGIGASPVETTNNGNSLIGWYQLNGNTNDGSGNGNHAAPYNLIYQTTVEVSTLTTSATGRAPTNGSTMQSGTLTGFFANSNAVNFGANRAYTANETSCGNAQNAFLNTNSVNTQIRITAVGFNGNSSHLSGCQFLPATKSRLSGWWPLDEGFGATAHDLSTNFNQLSFSGTFNSFPNWTVLNANPSNFQMADFEGGTSGIINIAVIPAYNTIATTNTFTVVAWALLQQVSPPVIPEGAVGDLSSQSGGSGFQLFGANPSGSAFSVGSGALGFPGNSKSIPPGNWVMLTGEYNGNSGQAWLYYNDTVVSTADIGKGLAIAAVSNIVIGNNGLSPSTGAFGGFLSNVQLYGALLSQSQISQLQSQGASGVPAGSSSLLGWWPLDGSPNDYSDYLNNGTTAGSFIFMNRRYANYSVPNPVYAAVFSPTSANALQSAGPVALLSSSAVTVAAWIDPMPIQANVVWNGVFRYGPGGACPGAGANTIQIGVQQNGLPELATWCNDFIPVNGPKVYYNSWNFIAGVLNGTRAHIFLNGRWVNGTLPRTAFVQPGPIVIGSTDTLGTAADRVFNGSVSDVQVYNAVLTPQQIAQLYEQGFPLLASVNVSG